MSGWRASDILGLTPGVESRRSDKLFLLQSRNVVFDSIGPKSDFGNRLLSTEAFPNVNHVQSQRVKLKGGDRTFYFLPQSILEWSESNGSWKTIYVIPSTENFPYRWTLAYLNGWVYFCHPRLTYLLALNVDSGLVIDVDTPGAPLQALAIVVDNGRLNAITQTTQAWSGPSDGFDWEPRLGGAGFQVIADRVAGDPVMITSYVEGTMVWTTGGVMRGQFTADQAVYRFRAMNTEIRLVNPFCSIQMDENSIVVLDERGLFKTQGEAPEPLTPLFNEFLIEFFRTNKMRDGFQVRLEWDALRRRIYLMVSFSESNPIYERAYVLYPSLDKWGSFDELHYGIVPIGIESGNRKGQHFGYVDADGFFRYWSPIRGRELFPTNPGLTFFKAPQQKPLRPVIGDSGWLSGSSFTLNSKDGAAGLPRAGHYAAESNLPTTLQLEGLNSFVRIGHLQFGGESAATELYEMNQVVVSSHDSRVGALESEDYLTSVNPNEDWNTGTGAEDWGTDTLNQIPYRLRVHASMDGYTGYVSEEGQQTFDSQSIKYWSVLASGVYFLVDFLAESAGEAFHIKTFAVDVTRNGSFT